MGLRPAKCYRSKKRRIRKGSSGHSRKAGKQRAYTRIAQKVPRKNYIGAAPALRIRQFNMGNPLLKYDLVADLVIKDGIDVRDNAIESARQGINRKLVKDLGKDGYFMKVRVFPSNILRENKQAQGAGADRVSQGMSLSFGVPIGRAARMKKGQALYSVLCFENQKTIVKGALLRAKSRISCGVDVVFHKDIKSLGTLPSKAVEEKVIEVVPKAGETAAGTEAAKTAATGADAGKTATADAKAPAGKTPAGKAPVGKTPAGKAEAKPVGKK